MENKSRKISENSRDPEISRIDMGMRPRNVNSMSNEDVVAAIKELAPAATTEEKLQLERLKDQLFNNCRGVIHRTAQWYNKNKTPTEDELQNAYALFFDKLDKYNPRRGAKFTTFINFYVRSALQDEHGDTYDLSRWQYADAKAKVNNPENYNAEEVREAARMLMRPHALTETNVAAASPRASAEDLSLAKMGSMTEEIETAFSIVAQAHPLQAKALILQLGLFGETQHKIAEIAEIMGTGERNIRNLIQSGLANMRLILDDDSGEMSTDVRWLTRLIGLVIAVGFGTGEPVWAITIGIAGLSALGVKVLARKITNKILARTLSDIDELDHEDCDIAA